VGLEQDALAELRELAAMHRMRMPRVVDGAQGAVAVVDGRELVNFASNDYLGLAGDARLARAAAAVLDECGTGAYGYGVRGTSVGSTLCWPRTW